MHEVIGQIRVVDHYLTYPGPVLNLFGYRTVFSFGVCSGMSDKITVESYAIRHNNYLFQFVPGDISWFWMLCNPPIYNRVIQ